MFYYFLIPAIVVIFVLIWYISTRNGIKHAEIKVDESLSSIDVALTKRFDCLTKILDVVKGYALHEKETLFEVITLRNGSSLSEKGETNLKLNNAFDKINIIAESYPELKSSENFKQLQMSIMDTEEHLQAARRFYNSNVSAYNKRIISFPSSIVASFLKAVKKEFFLATEEKRRDIKMEF